MTREEAIQLYRSGEEPTVEVLLEFSRRIEQTEEAVARKSTNSSNSARRSANLTHPCSGKLTHLLECSQN